ncbi:MAG: hypothetical protein V7749_08720 [Cocleimonas sp.]
MSSIKVVNFIQLLIINTLVLVSPFIFIEMYYLKDQLISRSTDYTCASKLTNYDYCSSITHIRYMELSDKWLPVVNYIDENRHSAYSNQQNFKSNGKRVFLIGDSFIQAEELYIEERFEHSLREEGYEVIAFGYSSWNTRQFDAIIHSLDIQSGDEVIFFSMGNDYTPSYNRSTIKTSLNVTTDSMASLDNRKFHERIYDNSVVINTFARAGKMVDIYMNNFNITLDPVPLISQSHDSHNWLDCASLPDVKNVATPLVHDYLSLSKNEKCWSKSIKESVDINVELFNRIYNTVKNKGANFRLALVSAGWAFENENSLGRRNAGYNISEDVVVSQIGLADKLQREGFDIINLEKLLEKSLDETSKEHDSLYFPADGHFTARSHQIIANHLIRILKD